MRTDDALFIRIDTLPLIEEAKQQVKESKAKSQEEIAIPTIPAPILPAETLLAIEKGPPEEVPISGSKIEPSPPATREYRLQARMAYLGRIYPALSSLNLKWKILPIGHKKFRITFYLRSETPNPSIASSSHLEENEDGTISFRFGSREPTLEVESIAKDFEINNLQYMHREDHVLLFLPATKSGEAKY